MKPTAKAPSADLDLTPTVWREAFGLAALLQQPRLIYRVNRVLAECMPPETEGNYPSFPASLASGLSSADFSHPEHRLIFDGWRMALDQHETDPIPYLLETLDPVAQQRLRGWLDKPFHLLDHVLARNTEQVTPERITETAIHALLELRRQRLTEHMQQLAFEVGDAEQNGEGMTWDLSELYKMLVSARHRVDQAQRHFGAPGSSGRVLFAKPKTAQ